MERLAREKIAMQQRLAELKNELSQSMDVLEIDRLLRQTVQPEDDQASTSTASGQWQNSTLPYQSINTILLMETFLLIIDAIDTDLSMLALQAILTSVLVPSKAWGNVFFVICL